MQRTLFQDAHITLTLDDDARLVRYVRSREPYATLDDVRALHAKIRELLTALPSGDLALLVDVRDAPARNDEAFEREVLAALTAMAARFSARATLVKSAVGKLQANRIAKAREQTIAVFHDEAQAVAYLTRTP